MDYNILILLFVCLLQALLANPIRLNKHKISFLFKIKINNYPISLAHVTNMILAK